MNVIKLAIGSGILLLSCGAYSQSISEKTNSDKKGAFKVCKRAWLSAGTGDFFQRASCTAAVKEIWTV